MKVAIPSNAPGGLEATISPHFGRCDVFTIVEIVEGKIVDVNIIENRAAHFGYSMTPAELLASSGVDAIIAQGMGPKAMQLFAQSGIAVYMTSATTVREAVRELTENKAKLASLEDACREARESSWPSSIPYVPSIGLGMGRGMGMQPYGPAYPLIPYPPQMPRPPPLPSGHFKVGVASQGARGLDDFVSPVFGRCPSFTIVEVEGKEIKGVKVLPNQYLSAPRGAGIATVQALANEGVRYILAGMFGPNVSAVASQLGIQMLTAPPGMKIRDAIKQYILGSP
jgi:predicted Fe-Mo cluster-binding NifX family protein